MASWLFISLTISRSFKLGQVRAVVRVPAPVVSDYSDERDKISSNGGQYNIPKAEIHTLLKCCVFNML